MAEGGGGGGGGGRKGGRESSSSSSLFKYTVKYIRHYNLISIKPTTYYGKLCIQLNQKQSRVKITPFENRGDSMVDYI